MLLRSNILNKMFLLIILFAPPVFAVSSLQITNIGDFEKWVEARILCQKSPYQTQETDKNFPEKMKTLGFKPMINLDDESGIYDGKVVIKKPVTIYGKKLKEISFYMDSGIGFYASIEASPNELVKWVKAKKLNKYPSQQNIGDSLYVFPTIKPDADGLTPEGIVINKTKNKNITQIGCQQFDY